MISLALLMALGIFLRTSLYNGIFGAVVVTLLVEPITLVIVLLLRPIFLRLYPAVQFAWRPVALTALLFGGGALIATAWAKFITTQTGWTVPTWSNAQSWLVPIGYYSIVLVSWGIARLLVEAEFIARQERERAAAAAAEALKAELNHLRSQLDPHFLFNSLGGIASEITLRPKAAVRMVRELADYLRYSLDHRDVTVSPFASEIEATQAYLELQKARFGRKLQFRLTADKAARRQRAPSFLLQPLVENAVKHGLKSGATPLDIAVKATCDGQAMRILVANSGTLHADWMNGGDPGVGLSVLRRRLVLHYPERHSFDMRQTGDKVTAELVLRGDPCSA